MRTKTTALIVAAGLSLGACATNDRYGYDRYGYGDRYGYDDRYGYGYDDRSGYGRRNEGQLGRAAAGAAIGAAAGAGVGAVVDGVSPGEGAIVGAIAGGAIGAATSNDRRWYRDRRGDCYYVNGRDERIYDYRRGC